MEITETSVRRTGVAYIGLDLGTRFGYAVLNQGGEIINSGQWRLDKASDEYFGTRLVRLRDNYTALISRISGEYEVDVTYEDVYRHMGTRAAHVFGMYLGVLEMCSAELGIVLNPVGVSTIKKLATGHGNAKKPEMGEAARIRWGLTPSSTDESDALFIAECGRLRP